MHVYLYYHIASKALGKEYNANSDRLDFLSINIDNGDMKPANA